MLKIDKQEIVSVYVYAVFNGLITLSIPLGIQAIISFLTSGQTSTSWIILVTIVILGIAFSGLMQIMQLTVTENIQQKIFIRSAFEFAYRIPKIKTETTDKQYVPELVNRFFDTVVIQKGLSKIIIDFSSASLQILFGLILLSFYHPFFIIFSIVLLLIVYIIFKFTTQKGIKTSLKESSFKYDVAYWLEEIAKNTSTFKLAGKTDLPLHKTDKQVEGYLTNRKEHFKTLKLQYINLVVFKVLIAAGLLITGGLLVINQQMNIGQFVASEIIIILVLASVEKLILSIETIYDVLTAIEKIGLITDLPLEEAEGLKVDENSNGLAIKAQKLSYKFDGEKKYVLKDISVNINSGEKICIVGESGAGKSFLLKLITGIYKQFEGNIIINGSAIDSYSQENLRSYIGHNTSEETIFNGTIYENISLGKTNISRNEVIKAATIVGLTDYIESLPKGYQSALMTEGKNLPKSIQLKIILARTIVANHKLILLEDSYQQLPKEDYKRLMDYILDDSKKWTVIAICSNKGLVKRFDKVMVLKKGELIEFNRSSLINNKDCFDSTEKH